MASPTRVRRSQLVSIALIGLLLGCAPESNSKDSVASTASVESLAEAYHLDSGDRLRINVFRHVDLSGEFVLDGNGNLALPLIGEVQGGGRTLRDLESQIEIAFAEGGFLVNPQVSVEVLSYRPFYILGEVNQPGSYPYVTGMTGITAVAMAGGFTYRARQSSMSVQRRGENEQRSMGLASTVLPGDILNIEERFF